MKSISNRVVALICAAGVGQRMKLDKPKQYLSLAGITMLERTVRALLGVERLERLVVVVSPEDPFIDALIAHFSQKVEILKVGGDTRAQSVCNGLRESGFDDDAWVLVHDAARPFVRPSEVAHLLDETLNDETVEGGILALPVADTLKRVDQNGRILETVDRSTLWRAATPQLFKVSLLKEALRGSLEGITDEASAVEKLGKPVKVVMGRASNIKVTTPSDLTIAQALIEDKKMEILRVGQGYDSHRLVAGRPLIVGGVTIDYEKGLDGHSDADVLLHAITDAILGASALGDIGMHFPPSDPQWKGADSMTLLKEVYRLAKNEGYMLMNIDATIVAEAPKMGPHILSMRHNLMNALGIELDQINIKAKTNEQMDAVGAREGMMAHAVALMKK